MPIKLVINGDDANKSCIYKITFRERFYIGCATWLIKRIKQHAGEINKLLAGAPFTERNEYYCHIVSHLNKYPEITEGIVSVVEEHTSDKGSIFVLERLWMDRLGREGMCLNTTQPQYYTEEEIAEFYRSFNG